jgi:hypothetical protein
MYFVHNGFGLRRGWRFIENHCQRFDDLGRSTTEATRLRFDQEKSRLHLIHGESSSHRGRAGERSAITN